MNCENCGMVMKLIPSGISKKTGKPYNAFYSCPGCGLTFNPTAQPPAKPKSAPKKDMDEVWEEKDLRMARMCGVKAATEMSKTNPDVKTVEEIIEVADKFVGYIYKGKEK